MVPTFLVCIIIVCVVIEIICLFVLYYVWKDRSQRRKEMASWRRRSTDVPSERGYNNFDEPVSYLIDTSQAE